MGEIPCNLLGRHVLARTFECSFEFVVIGFVVVEFDEQVHTLQPLLYVCIEFR
jgi:hypothetical protein